MCETEMYSNRRLIVNIPFEGDLVVIIDQKLTFVCLKVVMGE